MNFATQVSRTLDDEHQAALVLFGRLEAALLRGADAEVAALAPALQRQLEQDTGRHFDFEERDLFPRLDAAGDGAIAALLTEEHASIREVAAELLPLVRPLVQGAAAAAADRGALRRLGLELVERQVAHIQKETMALLPLLDAMLDPDTDRELAFAYAAS